MRRRRHRATGFTLIEMLIVLAILGLAVGLAIPLLAKRSTATTLAGATQQVRAALVAARSAAIAEDREIVFTGGIDGYRVDGARRGLPSAGLSVAIRGGTRISFFPSGGSSGGTVVLSGGTAEREIEVDAISGRAILVR